MLRLGRSFVYQNRFYGATWEPPWGQNTSTYAHEMGHSLGLPHSGWRYYAYDSPWDVMSGRATRTERLHMRLLRFGQFPRPDFPVLR